MSREDPELQELEETKAKLIQRATELRDATLRREQNILEKRTFNIDRFEKFLENANGTGDATAKDEKRTKNLCEASQSILGVRFEDVQKNWVHDNVYRYDAELITKALQFAIEFTVDIKSFDDYEIEDINCHFVNVDKNYLLEIAPWIHRFTKEKEFSHLISATSDYSEQSGIRAKILHVLDANGYVRLEKCGAEGGGILIYVHPPKENERIFLKFQWSTKFVDANWRIEHIFDIEPVQADDEFVKANSDLLKSFCHIGLREADLQELWNKMCIVMDNVKLPSQKS